MERSIRTDMRYTESRTEIENGLRLLLTHIGEDPAREGLRNTPARIIKAFEEMTAGTDQSPADILSTTFSCEYDELVLLRNIDFCSLCEHHCLPFVGIVDIAYVPDKKVVGLSKLARLVDCFAQRLQIQEQMTMQIADSIMKFLKPRGVGVIVKAKHGCMGCRGVRKPNAEMLTSSLLGCFLDDQKCRNEFLALAKN